MVKDYKFHNFLIRKNQVSRTLENSYVIAYDKNKSFLFPKAIAYKQNPSKDKIRMFDNVDQSNEQYAYLRLTYPKEGQFTTVKLSWIKKTIIGQNHQGENIYQFERDANNKIIYDTKLVDLDLIKDHFKSETKAIFEEIKLLKANNNIQKLSQSQNI